MRVFAKSADEFYYWGNGTAYHYDHGETYSFTCNEQFLSFVSKLYERKVLVQIDVLRDSNPEREVKWWFE